MKPTENATGLFPTYGIVEPRFCTAEVIDTATVTPDPETQARIDAYKKELDADLNIAIGATSEPLDSRKALLRTQEAAIGNLIADALRAQTWPTKPVRLVVAFPAGGLADVMAAADRYWEARLEASPLFATFLGDHRYDDQLPNSLGPDYRAAAHALNQKYLAAIRAIDPARCRTHLRSRARRPDRPRRRRGPRADQRHHRLHERQCQRKRRKQTCHRT